MVIRGVGLKQGQSVRLNGVWGTFNYMVGDEWAVVTLDNGQQRVVKAESLNYSGKTVPKSAGGYRHGDH